MAFAHDVWHVNAFGTSYQGAEQWTMGFWMGQEGADAGVPLESYANLIHARVATMFGTANNNISWAFGFNGIKIAHWDSAGHQLTANTVFSSGLPGAAGGEQRNQIPQAALAVSFRGAITRGPGANGRMYLPGYVNIPTAAGKIEQTDLDEIGGLCDTMFTGINSDIEGGTSGNYLINASKGTAGPPAVAPINVRVTHLRIGNVVDTIQRRRNSLSEQYGIYSLS